MTAMPARSVIFALDLASMPTLAPAMRQHPLPTDMLVLIRAAAGCPETCQALALAFDKPVDTVRDAAILYLQEVMLYEASDPYRVLGVLPDVTHAEAREHFQWLVKWLRPDLNAGAQETLLLQRVVSAWKTIGTPARRAEYDRSIVTRSPPPETGTRRRRSSKRRRSNRVRLRWVRTPLPPTAETQPGRWFRKTVIAMVVICAAIATVVLIGHLGEIPA